MNEYTSIQKANQYGRVFYIKSSGLLLNRKSDYNLLSIYQLMVNINPSREASHFLSGKPPQFIEDPDHAFRIELTVFEKVQPHFFNL